MNQSKTTRTAMVAAAIVLIAVPAAAEKLTFSFSLGDFTDPTTIDNDYWPATVLGTAVYWSEADDGCEVSQMVIDGTTTDFSGAYAGIQAVVVTDREWIDEECSGDYVLAESTSDWYAQDDYGNIWYMGEASRDFGDVEIDGEEVACPSLSDVALGAPVEDWPSEALFDECTAGSWESGIEGGEGDDAVVASPGIIVPADMPTGASGEPLSNGTYYLQEVAFEAQDMAKILRQDAPLSVDDGVDVSFVAVV